MKRLLILFFIIVMSYHCDAQEFKREYNRLTIVIDKKATEHTSNTKVFVNYQNKNQILISSKEGRVLFKYKNNPRDISTKYGLAQEMIVSNNVGKLFRLTLFNDSLMGIILNDGTVEINYHNIIY